MKRIFLIWVISFSSYSYSYSQLSSSSRPLSSSSASNFHSHYTLISPEIPIKWIYYPPNVTPKYGILMAGTRNKFSNHSSVYISICLAKLYAIQHQYAFTYHTNLGRINSRTYGDCKSYQMSPWNKIPLIQRYLTEVEILLWIDLDGVIQNMITPLESIIPLQWNNSQCNSYTYLRELGRDINITNPNDLPGTAEEPFIWMTLDINVKYSVNINTAVIAIRQSSLAFNFLTDVWNAGNNPNLFKQFDPQWFEKKPCVGYWGWPWEQGGIWHILQDRNYLHYLKASCILPHRTGNALNSVIDQWEDGYASVDRPLVIHGPKRDMGYWLINIMMKYLKPLVLIQQECHPSVSEKYHEAVKQWRYPTKQKMY